MTFALELDGVRAGYGRIEVLRGLDLQVPERSIVALLGPNGVGKTTTLRAITGTIRVTAGSVRLDGRRVDHLLAHARAARGLVLVPEGRGVFPSLSVEENLRIAHHAAPKATAAPWGQWLAEITATFPRLGERRAQLAGSLSGGEQQMLAVSRALAGDPRVILFDELSSGLAPTIVAELFDRVATLRDRGRTIVIVEQHLTHALDVADLCVVIAKGRVAWAGEPGEIRRSATAASYITA